MLVDHGDKDFRQRLARSKRAWNSATIFAFAAARGSQFDARLPVRSHRDRGYLVIWLWLWRVIPSMLCLDTHLRVSCCSPRPRQAAPKHEYQHWMKQRIRFVENETNHNWLGVRRARLGSTMLRSFWYCCSSCKAEDNGCLPPVRQTRHDPWCRECNSRLTAYPLRPADR